MINLNGTTTGYGANTAELANADIRIGNGAAPSNGLYSPAANQLALSTAGTGRLFINADGTIDFGTTSGSGTPTVKATSNPILNFSNGTNSAYVGLIGVNNRLINFSTNGTTLVQSDSTINLNVVGSDSFTVGTANTERLRITSDGNVGVGTSTPAIVSNRGIHVYAGSGLSAGVRVTGNNGTGLDIIQAADGSGYIYQRDNSFVAFGTNNTERLRITSDGKVGIGTSSPGATLDVTTSGNGRFQVQPGAGIITYKTRNTSDSGYGSAIHDATQHIFQYVGNEAARIDSSGRLLVGTSAARSSSGVSDWQLQIEKANAFTGASIVANSNDVYGAYLVLGKTRGTSNGSNTIVQNGDRVGEVAFAAADGNDTTSVAASIVAFVDSTPGADDMPGRLVFSTTADGAATPTEAMRINNQRELLIGTTTRTANGGVLQISNGITFPGTQSACSDPNTLDDYEEGTWTPTIVGVTTAGAGTYSTQYGSYTKIGNCVYFQAKLTWTAHTGTGNMRISGLPFASKNVIGADNPVASYAGNLALTASNCQQAYVPIDSTQVLLEQVPVGGGTSTAVPIDTAATVLVSGHYYV